MSTLYLDTNKIRSSQEAYEYLKTHKIQEGDEVRIVTDQEQLALTAIVVLVILAIVNYFDEETAQKKNFGSKIMDDLFGNKDQEVLEREIEMQYGIRIAVEHRDVFREEWTKSAAKGLAGTYDEEEPDYSDVEVKEKNPNYQGPAQI